MPSLPNLATRANLGVNSRYDILTHLEPRTACPLTECFALDQLIETVAFAFSIMGVVASVSSTFSFPLVSGKLLIRGTILFVFGEDGLCACIL